MKHISPKNIKIESHDAVICILELIEYLCKLDVELKLEDGNSLKNSIQESDGFSNGFDNLVSLQDFPTEAIKNKAIFILKIYIEQKHINGPESDPVHILISNGDNDTREEVSKFKPKVQIPTLTEQ